MTDRAKVKVTVYDTSPTIYDAFARLFPEQESNGHRWIDFYTTTGVEVTLFASDAQTPAGPPVSIIPPALVPVGHEDYPEELA